MVKIPVRLYTLGEKMYKYFDKDDIRFGKILLGTSLMAISFLVYINTL